MKKNRFPRTHNKAQIGDVFKSREARDGGRQVRVIELDEELDVVGLENVETGKRSSMTLRRLERRFDYQPFHDAPAASSRTSGHMEHAQ